MYGVKYWEENCWASKSLKLWSPLTFRPGWQVQSFQVSRLLKPYLERCFGLLRMSIRTSVCIEKLNFDINVVHTHQLNQNHVFLTGQSPFEPDETPLCRSILKNAKQTSFPSSYILLNHQDQNMRKCGTDVKETFFSPGTWGKKRATQDNAELKGWHLRLLYKWV